VARASLSSSSPVALAELFLFFFCFRLRRRRSLSRDFFFSDDAFDWAPLVRYSPLFELGLEFEWMRSAGVATAVAIFAGLRQGNAWAGGFDFRDRECSRCLKRHPVERKRSSQLECFL
jgi:hypothetical protein